MAQRTWFITGVSSGLGRTAAKVLLERGDRVAGTARKVEQLNDLQTKYGDPLLAWPTRPDGCDGDPLYRRRGL